MDPLDPVGSFGVRVRTGQRRIEGGIDSAGLVVVIVVGVGVGQPRDEVKIWDRASPDLSELQPTHQSRDALTDRRRDVGRLQRTRRRCWTGLVPATRRGSTRAAYYSGFPMTTGSVVFFPPTIRARVEGILRRVPST